MGRRSLLVAAALVSAIDLSVLVLADQSSSGRSGATSKLRLTPDGQPDLQGYWTNDTYTPLERPAELAGQGVLHRRRKPLRSSRAASTG